jgi:hypothetical protein
MMLEATIAEETGDGAEAERDGGGGAAAAPDIELVSTAPEG